MISVEKHYNNPPASTKEYYDIIIDDPELTVHGFTKFILPTDENATKMILYNDKDPSMITYVDFDKHDLIKSVELLHDKLVDEQLVDTKAGKDTLEGLVAYFRNKCVELQEDKHNYFFKDRNGKARRIKQPNSGNSSVSKQQDLKPANYTAYKYSKNGRIPLHEAVIWQVARLF